MAITPQHEKGEPTEADLQHAYEKARSIGLFLVEKYAREVMRSHLDLFEFVNEPGTDRWDGKCWGFSYGWMDESHEGHPSYKQLVKLLVAWAPKLDLLTRPMRFSAYGPVRREW